MPPDSASPKRGGFSPTPSPSNETGDSDTFTETGDEVNLRESDDTSLNNLKPLVPSVLPSDNNLPMPNPDESTPLPNGDGDRGSDFGASRSPTPVRKRQEPYYSNEGESTACAASRSSVG